MDEKLEKLNESLSKNKNIVYVDDNFFWKDIAYQILEKRNGVKLTSDQADIDLYRMYEFSDKFDALSESEQYGSIWNYVRAGLITPEEALSAIIYKV